MAFLSRSVTAKFMAPTVLLILLISFVAARFIGSDRSENAFRLAEAQANGIFDLVNGELTVNNTIELERVKGAIRIYRMEVEAAGSPGAGPMVQVAGATVPDVLFGATPQANRSEFVSDLSVLLGTNVTLFTYDGASFVRIATTVRDEKGNFALGTPLDPQSKSYAALKAGTPYYGFTRLMGKHVIAAYEPLRDAQGALIGALFVGAELEAFDQIGAKIQQTRILEHGYVALVDAANNVIFRSAHVDDDAVRTRVTAAEDAAWVVRKSTFDAWGYTTLVAYPVSDVDAMVARSTAVLVLVTIAVTILMIVLLYLIINRVVIRTIRRLAGATDRVCNGHLEEVQESGSEDELGRLTTGFNTMVGNIRSSMDEAHRFASQAQEAAGVAEQARTEAETRRAFLSAHVDTMLTGIHRFADGDLTVHFDDPGDDQMGRLFSGFNRAIENVRAMMERVGTSVSATASAAAQISSSTEELSVSGSELDMQSSEVAGAVEQMTRTIAENSKAATDSADAAASAGQTTRESRVVVRQTVEKIQHIAEVISAAVQTIEKLGASSNEIGEIAQVIEEIAGQTNLLALNAAIEAARAGQQGRGFAVVADEVRKLAERTDHATKQIGQMIRSIQDETNEAVRAIQQGNREAAQGIELAGQADASLEKAATAVKNAVDRVLQIAAATEEQSATSEQIARSIEGMAAAISQSTAAISQIAQAADGLNSQATDLEQQMTGFVVHDGSFSSGDGLPLALHHSV